jgi:hypothetical protein
MLEAAADDTIVHLGHQTGDAIEGAARAAHQAVGMASHSRVTATKTLEERMRFVPLLREALADADAINTIFLAFGDGDFFLLRRIPDERDRRLFNAPAGARYLVQSIDRVEGGPPTGRYVYLDGVLNPVRTDDRPEYVTAYDPREREWYKAAITSGFPIHTAPYVFASSGRVGSTIARSSAQPGVVVGADIRLDTLGAMLGRLKATPKTEVALVDREGFVLAHEDVANLLVQGGGADSGPRLRQVADFGRPPLAAAASLLAAAGEGRAASGAREVGEEKWRLRVSPVVVPGAPAYYLVVAVPDHELFGAAYRLRTTSFVITLAVMLASLPIVWLVARGIARGLRALLEDAEAVRRFRFSERPRVRSMVKEVDELSETMDGMKGTIRRFLEINAAVAGERNFARLLPMLLRETMTSADANFGVLYLADGEALVPMATLDRDSGAAVTLPRVPYTAAGPLLAAALAEGKSRTALLGRTIAPPRGSGTSDPARTTRSRSRSSIARTISWARC